MDWLKGKSPGKPWLSLQKLWVFLEMFPKPKTVSRNETSPGSSQWMLLADLAPRPVGCVDASRLGRHDGATLGGKPEGDTWIQKKGIL